MRRAGVMIQRVVVCVVLLLLAPSGLAAPSSPDLAASYTTPSAGMVAALWTDPELDKPAPAVTEQTMPSNTGAPPRVVVSDARAEQLRQQFERGARIHRTGVILAIGGAIVVPTSGLILISAAFGGNEPVAAIAGVTFIGSSIAYITGGVMASMGSVTATRAVNEVLGVQLPLGVAWAGVALSTVGLLAIPVGGIGLAGPLLGAVCGAVQMGQANRALGVAGLASLHVLPTANGVQVVGRF